MQVELTFIKDTERTSAKTGKPYTSRSIKTQEYGDKYLSGFRNKDNAGWKVGDKVEIEVKEVKKDDKTFLNFETPKKEDPIMEKLEKLSNDMLTLKLLVRNIDANTSPKKRHYPTAQEEGIDLDAGFPEDDIEDEMSNPPSETD